MNNAKHVASISRRTDIPALYTPWFLQRVDEGFCDCFNPFNQNIYRVSLTPDDCLAWVFWTRDPGPLLPHLEPLRQKDFRFCMHFTLNGYPSLFETNNRPLVQSIDTFRRASELLNPEFLFWRYDPIILSSLTPFGYHVEQFEFLCSQLQGYTFRCYTSFVDLYAKTRKSLNALEVSHGIRFEDPSTETKRRLLTDLNEIARSYGLTLYACCEENLVTKAVVKASCVDLDVIRRLRPDVEFRLRKAPSRKNCACVKSVDIGVYQTCTHGCVYCYANSSLPAAKIRNESFDKRDSMLWRPKDLYPA